MNMRTIILTAVLLTVAMPPILYPQTPGPSSPAQTESAGDDETPVPYDPEEFPQWARDLRRGEIVATGSFPLTLLASRLLYGLGRFLVQSIQSRGVTLPTRRGSSCRRGPFRCRETRRSSSSRRQEGFR